MNALKFLTWMAGHFVCGMFTGFFLRAGELDGVVLGFSMWFVWFFAVFLFGIGKE